MTDLQPASPAASPPPLFVALEVGERIVVTVPSDEPGKPPRRLSVTLLAKSGRRARLRVAADEDVNIERGQIAVTC